MKRIKKKIINYEINASPTANIYIYVCIYILNILLVYLLLYYLKGFIKTCFVQAQTETKTIIIFLCFCSHEFYSNY